MGRRRPAMSIVATPSAQQTSPPSGNIYQKRKKQKTALFRGNPRRAAAANSGRGSLRGGRSVTALMYACQQGDVERVRRIVRAQPFSLMQRDRTGKSPLHYCTTSDRVTAAQAADLLVMAAPDLVEGRDDEGFTPLHLAVIAGNVQLVTFLLANKADVSAVDSERHTVVHWATVCGETEALRAVLAAGAPVSTPDIHGGFPLHYAAQMCGGEKDSMLGLQVLHTLLSHPAINVSVEDDDRRQPLLWAASAGSAKAVLALVRAGAAVEASDKDGLTALHCAASRGHTDCLDTLLTLCGACPDVIDSNGCTALHYAVTLGHADATALLLAHGANANRQDRKGRSPAHCGCAKGQFETVKILGGHGGNLWLRNARGDFPLHEAAASGRRDLVKWLLEMRPSQVNARNSDGRCPLHMAALHDNADMCKILLDAGAQVNPVLRTSKNVFMTPLDCALQRGFRSTAKFLQLHGGVPASKLANARKNENVMTSANLNIRDDVTLWGDSSDDERETTERSGAERKKLRSYRKKNKKEESGRQSKRTIKMKGTTSDEVLRYSSEVIVSDDRNGTINIEQNGEVILSERQPFVKSKIPVTATEKRPKSAKRTKTRSKTTATTQEEEKNLEELGKEATSTTTSTQESKSSIETVVQKEVLKTQEILEEVVPKIESLVPPPKAEKEIDKQSLLSSTSLDEGDKQVVVEAHVHSPPKVTSVEEVKKSEEGITEKGELEDAASEVKQQIKETLGGTEDLKSSKDVGEEKEEIEVVEKQASIAAQEKEKETKDLEKAIEGGAAVELKTAAGEVAMEEVAKESSREGDKSKKLTKQTTVLVDPSEALNDVADVASSTIDGVKDIVEETLTAAKEEVKKEVVAAEKDVAEGKETIAAAVDQVEVVAEDTVAAAEEGGKFVDGIVSGVEEVIGKQMEDAAASKEGVEEGLKVKMETQDGSEMKSEEGSGEKGHKEGDRAVEVVAAKKEDVEKMETEKGSGEERLEKDVQSDEVVVAMKEDGKKRKTRETREAVKDSGEARHKEDEVVIIDGRRRKPKENELSKSKKSIQVTESQSKKRQFLKPKPQKPETQYDASVEMKSSEEDTTSPSSSSKDTKKEHKSFRVLDDSEEPAVRRVRSKSQIRKPKKLPLPKQRSKSEESARLKRSKIPTPIHDRHLLDLSDSKRLRTETSMTAPIHASFYSDNERDTGSDVEDATRRKRLKKRGKSRGSKSAGSDYESSNLIDSGFEPSPRSSRLPKWKNVSERGVDMTSVTQTIQTNIRRYHLERKIFQHLLELKRLQIRAGQHNEAILVKRAIDAYHKSCASTVGAGRYIADDYTFKAFEKFLYQSLRKLQKNGADYLKGLPESPDHPLLCTQSTHKCMHATHAYTGVPCAAYLPKLDHHTIPKIGFDDDCKPSGFLPHIHHQKSKGVTLELCHGSEKQLISLPADRLDQNKRYYVTFTVKGADGGGSSPEDETGHRHSKSD